MRYGDLVFKNEPVGNFYGNKDLPAIADETIFSKFFMKARLLASPQAEDTKRVHITATNSRDIKLQHLYATVSSRKSHTAQLDLAYELTSRMRADHVFEAFAPQTEGLKAGYTLPRNFDCLKTLMNTYT